MKLKRRQFLTGSLTTGLVSLSTARAEEMMAPREKFRVLSLDGGGARGYLSAGILANIESYLNIKTGVKVPLGKRFDLIAGTSTGGIIALGLATGRSAVDVKMFFRDLVPRIFAESERAWYSSRLLGPEYGIEKLTHSLKGFFGEATLRDVTTDICVTAVSLENGMPYFHKSNYRKILRRFGPDETLATRFFCIGHTTYFQPIPPSNYMTPQMEASALIIHPWSR